MTPRVKAWMRQAESDAAVAKLNAEQGFHSQACYHAGQAAEKALKALIVEAGNPPPIAIRSIDLLKPLLNWASIWRRYSNFISRLLAV